MGGSVRAAFFAAVLGVAVWVAVPALREGVPLVPTSSPGPQAPVATATPRSSAAGIDVRARADGSVTLTLSDADLTAVAQPYFPQTFMGVTVRDPSVRVGGGTLALHATAQTFFGSGPLVAAGRPSAVDGRLVIRVDSVTIGGATMPENVRAETEKQLQAVLDAALSSRVHVTSVAATGGTLTVTGRAR